MGINVDCDKSTCRPSELHHVPCYTRLSGSKLEGRRTEKAMSELKQELSSQGQLLNALASQVSEIQMFRIGSYITRGEGKVPSLSAIALTRPNLVSILPLEPILHQSYQHAMTFFMSTKPNSSLFSVCRGFGRPLVKTSASCIFDCTYPSVTTSRSTSSRIKWCFMSICLVRW